MRHLALILSAVGCLGLIASTAISERIVRAESVAVNGSRILHDFSAQTKEGKKSAQTKEDKKSDKKKGSTDGRSSWGGG